MCSWGAISFENACYLQTVFGKCAPCVILLSLPSPADLSPLLSVSLHSRSESPHKHRWSASPFASTAQVSLAPTELLDQGSGLWPSMQLVSVTSGPHTLEMSLQTDVVWDLWCAATRVSDTVLLIRSSSCLFLVRHSTICLISCRWPSQTQQNQPPLSGARRPGRSRSHVMLPSVWHKQVWCTEAEITQPSCSETWLRFTVLSLWPACSQLTAKRVWNYANICFPSIIFWQIWWPNFLNIILYRYISRFECGKMLRQTFTIARDVLVWFSWRNVSGLVKLSSVCEKP